MSDGITKEQADEWAAAWFRHGREEYEAFERQLVADCKERGLMCTFDPERQVYKLFLLPGWQLSAPTARDAQPAELHRILEMARRRMLRDALGL